MNYKIGRITSILYRRSSIYMNLRLKKYDLTAAEQPFLLYLYHSDRISQEDLSNYLLIDKASTARAIQSLIRKGYVRKEKSQTDKRYNIISLTDKANACQNEIYQILHEWSQFLTQDLDPDDIAVTAATLEKMVLKVEQTDFKEKWREL